MNAWITVRGKQGHSAYPQLADNPVHRLTRVLHALTSAPLDAGSDWFEASTLQVTGLQVDNTATNVIPAEARAVLNIRFNDRHTGASLTDWLTAEAAKVQAETGVKISVRVSISGESFLTPPGSLSSLVGKAVKAETGIEPEMSTSGGTSDARFVKDHCPVVEFGLVGKTMHQVDERVAVAQIHQLKAIYGRILRDYFA